MCLSLAQQIIEKSRAQASAFCQGGECRGFFTCERYLQSAAAAAAAASIESTADFVSLFTGLSLTLCTLTHTHTQSN